MYIALLGVEFDRIEEPLVRVIDSIWRGSEEVTAYSNVSGEEYGEVGRVTVPWTKLTKGKEVDGTALQLFKQTFGGPISL